MSRAAKPTGRKAYGSIPHLPTSRLGPTDRSCHPGQARIATEQARDHHDRILVQEKLDGACVAVAKVACTIHALGRAGYPADSSPFEQHHLFADWVADRHALFSRLLDDGERLVGEWLAQAHATRYQLDHPPLVVFDLMTDARRASYDQLTERLDGSGLPQPHLLSDGPPLAPQAAMTLAGEYGHHGATDPIEGAVWRVERSGTVDYLVKWVRPGKQDGALLPELTGAQPVWNWRPDATVPRRPAA